LIVVSLTVSPVKNAEGRIVGAPAKSFPKTSGKTK